VLGRLSHTSKTAQIIFATIMW